ncbi:MAG: glutamine synthetase [Alphaproteobacteria bacterium]|nr:glutamine synthetase [Alphaproteobacteria bacterium]MBU0797822.1 glutamine synthetase [Alphaproteobacteria bacterium]MBU0885857.1 glutamine synthetase [Alphaproteobacteria bacterium]MBU1814586.1 glutamine synthetase [Alphaproteobacteria bacterium]MBU2089458.1 glutamine synthetase [Alphaproteobacteria bacterium]
MEPSQVRNAADARKIVEERGLSHVKVGVFDMDGLLRGKYMAREKFFSSLESGFGFCDVVLGWDMHDELYDNVAYTGWHTGYPDATVRILPESCREIPLEDNMLFFMGEFEAAAEAICPRGTLRRVLAKAADMGFTVKAGFEYEFFLFDETPDSVREKGYRGLKPITPGMFGYSLLRSTVYAEFYQELLALSETMDFPIEGLHTETGPGVLEAAIKVDDGLAAADKAALFKTFTKILAQRNGLMATFMAKWSSEVPGQSGHLHLSLMDKKGKPVFHDAKGAHGMSTTMRHFLGGQQKLMPEMLAMIAPTVNSFSRLIPGFWAPTASLWGVENRTCALRVIGGSPQAQRIEYRVGAADGNPYLVQAAALASGLWGIENEIEPEAPITGNAYDVKPPARLAFPATLWEAAQRLRRSKPARSLLGDAFVEHFAATREWEERQYRKHISDWELKRYFEII